MIRATSASVLAVVVGMVMSPERRSEGREAIDEVIHPWAVSIVDTPTPPTGSRRIDVSRWEDLLRAAELLGRPILRLHGGEGGPEGRLFYVADGPQSYVFGFSGTPVSVSRSGAYAPPSPPAPIPLPTPPATTPAEVAVPEPSPPTPPRHRPPVVAPLPTPANPSPSEPDPADALLGPELPEGPQVPELPDETAVPSATVVERRIREMIHELLDDFRKLPPSSDTLELGTEHIQRAIDMLHLGRYGIAQFELNKAARILKEAPPI
jgi:hypothetical protein